MTSAAVINRKACSDVIASRLEDYPRSFLTAAALPTAYAHCALSGLSCPIVHDRLGIGAVPHPGSQSGVVFQADLYIDKRLSSSYIRK